MTYCLKNEQEFIIGLKIYDSLNINFFCVFFLRIINEFLDDVIKNQGLSPRNNGCL